MDERRRPSITRRDVLVGMTTALAVPAAAGAQPAVRAARVSLYAAGRTSRDAIVEVLRERGWVEGRTIGVDWHPDNESHTRIPAHLAKAPPDVLVVGGAHRIRAAMRATTTIPIIGLDLESDPVASGFVTTLARPGGHVSGIWMDLPEIAGKQIQFLREVVPGLGRLGVVWDDRIGALHLGEVQAVCRAAGITVQATALRVEADVDDVMKRVVAERPQAMLVLTAPVISHVLPRIGELALHSGLPSISPFSTFPGFGGLMAYGPDFPAMWRQLAHYVDRVLKGARVGELPVERPSKFTLIVSRRTARALALTLPPSLVLRADEVIQ